MQYPNVLCAVSSSSTLKEHFYREVNERTSAFGQCINHFCNAEAHLLTAVLLLSLFKKKKSVCSDLRVASSTFSRGTWVSSRMLFCSADRYRCCIMSQILSVLGSFLSGIQLQQMRQYSRLVEYHMSICYLNVVALVWHDSIEPQHTVNIAHCTNLYQVIL